MRRGIVFLAAVISLLYSNHLGAQSFSSGSTGVDGALDCASGNLQVLSMPPSGVFNFTTVTIPAGCDVTFAPNSANTPVMILASGDVRISGMVRVDGDSVPARFGLRTPGPGGFPGGFPGSDGLGPGGGINSVGHESGTWVGPVSLVPPVGGSGGFGPTSYGGGGGGGAIVIASSTRLDIQGTVSARGQGGLPYPGSGGAIRLVSNEVNVGGTLNASGGSGGCYIWCFTAGGAGIVRIEAPPAMRTFNGSSTPSALLADINPVLLPTSGTPSLTLTSIGGVPISSTAGSRVDTADVLLPTQMPEPIVLGVQAANIPVGTQVTASINGLSGSGITPGTLVGTDQLSTGSIQLSGLDRTRLNYIFVTTTFDVSTMALAGNTAGVNQVARVRIDAAPGAASQVTFLRTDGSVIPPGVVPNDVRRAFGQ